MSKNQRIGNKLNELTHAHLLPVLEEKINAEVCFIRNFQDAVASFTDNIHQDKSEGNVINALLAYQTLIHQLHDFTVLRHKERKAQSFEEIYKNYYAACNTYISTLRKNKKEIQKKERFLSQPSDSTLIKFQKFWKRLFFQFSQLPVQSLNFFRKLVKKEPLPENTWSQVVPFRKLVTLYFKDQLALSLLPLYIETDLVIAKTSCVIWKVEEQIFTTYYPFLQKRILNTEQENPFFPNNPFQIQIDNASSELINHKQQFKRTVKQKIHETLTLFNQAYEKAGTLELPHSKINKQFRKQQNDVNKAYEKNSLEWSNTLFSLHEDWRIDQELNLLSVTQLHAFHNMQQRLESKIFQQIIPNLKKAKICIDEILSDINKQVDNKNINYQILRKTLQQSRATIDADLVKNMLPKVVEVLYKQRLPIVFDNLSNEIQDAIQQVSQERGLVNTKSYEHPIKSSEINFVSPFQIVAFESLPKFLNGIQEYQHTVKKIQIKIQQRVHEIGQIAYFNLDSALSALEKEEPAEQQPLEIAKEGLQRADKSIDHIIEELSHIKTEAESSLSAGIISFNNKLNELKNNDYALEIKFRVARAKAIERAKELRQKMLTHAKNLLPAALNMTIKIYREGTTLLKAYQKKIGIEASSEKVTTEISDFLSETEAAINRLPFVYQRLFNILPLEEEIFYEERTLEYNKLSNAFENWKKGRYASVALVGEKGSGITTLINFFLKRLNTQDQRHYKIIRAYKAEQIWQEARFYEFFNHTFSGNNFENLDDIIQHLHSLDQPHIIILEHIEHLFLKKIGGFACLKLLFELISKTNKQVFWISSSTVYSWQYLNKTLHISDYYEYIIKLENIENEKMREVILKRHRVSGYGLKFIPPSHVSNKKLDKMSEQERQDYLRDIYFANLNEITAGNFSLAQLYWMRSAQEVTEDTIIMESLDELDFSFIRTTPFNKTIVLHSLLLHDGLTEEQYALITNQMQLENSKIHPLQTRLELLQLLDDGLIVTENDIYYINPLLYRPVVSLLKTRNFLH